MFKKQYGCTPSEYRAGLSPEGDDSDFLSESIQYFPSQEDTLAILLPFRDRFSSPDPLHGLKSVFHFS